MAMPAGFAPENVGTFALIIIIMVGLGLVGFFWGRIDTYRDSDNRR